MFVSAENLKIVSAANFAIDPVYCGQKAVEIYEMVVCFCLSVEVQERRLFAFFQFANSVTFKSNLRQDKSSSKNTGLLSEKSRKVLDGWSRQFSQEREENFKFNFRPRTEVLFISDRHKTLWIKRPYEWLKRKYGGHRDKISVIFKGKNRKSFARLFTKSRLLLEVRP